MGERMAPFCAASTSSERVLIQVRTTPGQQWYVLDDGERDTDRLLFARRPIAREFSRLKQVSREQQAQRNTHANFIPSWTA